MSSFRVVCVYTYQSQIICYCNSMLLIIVKVISNDEKSEVSFPITNFPSKFILQASGENRLCCA